MVVTEMFEIALGISGRIRERVQPMEVAIEIVFAIALFIHSMIILSWK